MPIELSFSPITNGQLVSSCSTEPAVHVVHCPPHPPAPPSTCVCLNEPPDPRCTSAAAAHLTRTGERAHCGCIRLTVRLVKEKQNHSLILNCDLPLPASPSPVCAAVDPLPTPWSTPGDPRTAPGRRGLLSLMHQRHSVVGVLTIHRPQSDGPPAPPSDPPRAPPWTLPGNRVDGRHLTLRKAVSEERPRSSGGESASSLERGERMRG